jgi:hypothetical protein
MYLNLKPLKNPLEGRITTLRVVRHLQKSITLEQYEKLCFLLTKKFYNEDCCLVNQKNSKGKNKKKVVAYSINDLEEILNTVNKFLKPKRPRI